MTWYVHPDAAALILNSGYHTNVMVVESGGSAYLQSYPLMDLVWPIGWGVLPYNPLATSDALNPDYTPWTLAAGGRGLVETRRSKVDGETQWRPTGGRFGGLSVEERDAYTLAVAGMKGQAEYDRVRDSIFGAPGGRTAASEAELAGAEAVLARGAYSTPPEQAPPRLTTLPTPSRPAGYTPPPGTGQPPERPPIVVGGGGSTTGGSGGSTSNTPPTTGGNTTVITSLVPYTVASGDVDWNRLVQDLYREVLGREASASEISTLANQLYNAKRAGQTIDLNAIKAQIRGSSGNGGPTGGGSLTDRFSQLSGAAKLGVGLGVAYVASKLLKR